MTERNIQDVYGESQEYDPVTYSFEEDEDEEMLGNDEIPMLPSLAANILATTTNDITFIKGPNDTFKIIFLTICLAGLQFTWTVEMAYGRPYLLSLGLSKSYMSLVWIAGPLSGLVMQPIVGVISDSSKSKYGRRRPFLVGGCIVVVLSLLLIGWTRELSFLLTREKEGDRFKTMSIIIAIASIYILDFSVNCVQASCRALIVDSLPSSQQENGTAWAGRMVGLGSVVGYFMGYADLVKVFPFFGDTQLKVLCVFATIVLLGCNFITCYTVKEKAAEHDHIRKSKSPFALFPEIFRHIWHLPQPIQYICNVQFFAWIGWFPFLFYSTTWVADIYSKHLTDVNDDKVGQATRAGSFAFLVYSIVSLSSSFLLPLFVSPKREDNNKTYTIRLFEGREIKLTWLKYLKLSFLTLPRAWTISQFIFCVSMLSTILVSDVTAASIVIGFCGISWAISMWAPFSLLGEYISEQEASQQVENSRFRANRMMTSRASLVGISMLVTEQPMYPPTVSEEEDIEMLGIKESTEEDRNEAESSHSAETPHVPPAAGVVLGIHNMYIVLPQFLVTLSSSIVFKILENRDGSDAIGIILRFGAVMAGIAGYLSLKIKNA